MPEDQSTNIAVDPPTETPTEPVKAPEWQASLAKRFGVDVSGFSDEANALSAIRMTAENSARAGVQSAPVVQTPEPVEPVKPSEVTAESLGLEGDEIDANILQAFQVMSIRHDKKIADLQTAYDKQIEQVTADSSVSGTANAQTANTLIDKLASPKYGVGDNRTVPQQMAVNKVFEIAELIAKGGSVQGMSVENIVEMALLSDAGVAMSSVQGNPPPEPTSAGGAAGEKKIYGRKPVTKRGDNPIDPMGLLEDPVFRAGVTRILDS